MYKIIETDNFDGDYPAEVELARKDSEGSTTFIFPNEKQAQLVCDALNKALSNNTSSLRYYKVVDYQYILQPGFEP